MESDLQTSAGVNVRHAATLIELEVRALAQLKQLKVRVIVIDETHNLVAGSAREQRVML